VLARPRQRGFGVRNAPAEDVLAGLEQQKVPFGRGAGETVATGCELLRRFGAPEVEQNEGLRQQPVGLVERAPAR
jgi:hypothetical protein